MSTAGIKTGFLWVARRVEAVDRYGDLVADEKLRLLALRDPQLGLGEQLGVGIVLDESQIVDQRQDRNIG